MADIDSVYKFYSEDDNDAALEYSYKELEETLDDFEKGGKYRVGKRIRKIRETKGISRAELGEKIGLNSDRLQKYENGAQMPRNEMLIKIADALEVNVISLVDPVAMDSIGALFAMFEMEHNYQAKIEAIEDTENPKMALTFGIDTKLYKYMRYWYLWNKKTEGELKDAQSEEERENINKAYLDWEWNTPFSLWNNRKAIDKMVLKSEIERLQKLYNESDW